MKMKRAHYEIIREHMARSRHTPIVEQFQGKGLSPRSFAWHWFYATPIEGMRPEAWVCSELYPYLNDSHIETALLRILKTV